MNFTVVVLTLGMITTTVIDRGREGGVTTNREVDMTGAKEMTPTIILIQTTDNLRIENTGEMERGEAIGEMERKEVIGEVERGEVIGEVERGEVIGEVERGEAIGEVKRVKEVVVWIILGPGHRTFTVLVMNHLGKKESSSIKQWILMAQCESF